MSYDLSHLGGVEEKSYDLSHLGGQIEESNSQTIQPEQQSLFRPSNIAERGLSDILAGAANFSQDLGGLPYKTAQRLGASQSTLSHLPQPTNIDFSSYFGVKDPNMLDKLVSGGIEAIPAIMTGGSSLIGQVGAGAGQGYLMSKEHPIIDTILGAVGGSASKAIPAAGKFIGKTAQSLFGKGTPSFVASNIADSLRPSAINELKSMGSDMYQSVFDKLPKNTNIYQNLPLKIGSDGTNIPVNTYQDLNSDIVSPNIRDLYPRSLKLANDLFVKNPTPDNAHTLYKQLGAEVGKYNYKEAKAGSLDAVSNKLKDTFDFARQQVKSDLASFMSAQDPSLFAEFNRANEFWKQNVVPRERLSLSLAKMGEEPKASDLFNKLTKQENFASNIQERTGREQYFPGDVSNALKQLDRSLKYNKYAKTGLKTAGLGALGAGIEHYFLEGR